MNGLTRIMRGAVCLWLLATGNLMAQDADPELRGRFLAAVKETGRKVERLSFRVKWKQTFDYAAISDEVLAMLKKIGKDPFKPEVRIRESVIRGDSAAMSGVHGKGFEFVMAKNARYAFLIERLPSVNRYSLQFVSQLGADQESDERVKMEALEARATPLCAWYVMSDSVSQLVESPSFKIKKVATVSSEGRELVRVDFEHLVDDPTRAKSENRLDAYLVCDPAHAWALKEYRFTVVSGGTIHVVINEFGDMVDGFPIARKMTQLVTQTDKISTSRMVVTLEAVDNDVSEEQFYLSHYGLPEPTFRRSWLSTWMWYLIAGFVCMAVLAMLLKRRRATV